MQRRGVITTKLLSTRRTGCAYSAGERGVDGEGREEVLPRECLRPGGEVEFFPPPPPAPRRVSIPNKSNI